MGWEIIPRLYTGPTLQIVQRREVASVVEAGRPRCGIDIAGLVQRGRLAVSDDDIQVERVRAGQIPDRPVSDAHRLQMQRRSCLIRASSKPQVGNVYDMFPTRWL